jgi:hypothetical protein
MFLFRHLGNLCSTPNHDLLGAISSPRFAVLEDGIAGRHVGFIPGVGAKAAVGDGVVSPDDGDGIEVRYARARARGLGGIAEEGGRGDAARDVCDERGKAEGEELEPLGDGDGLALVRVENGGEDDFGIYGRGEEDEKEEDEDGSHGSGWSPFFIFPRGEECFW